MTPPVSAPALAALCWNIHDSPVTRVYPLSLSREIYVVRRRVMGERRTQREKGSKRNENRKKG